jgi:hypothetical protein
VVTERPVTPAARTAASDERARRGRREVRLQLRPETAKAIEAMASEPGRQGFSDALNRILERYDKER